ncbi:hypothetical protein IWW36_001416 [Coemansia brasiliensis]|uniref:Uncharacterized protein n=1 Tax=Coemansia brasiliensis TaxID=2650707 RepID=A0A9W8I974_9FUNG|nr:hypothetical protein IWW36_001416 [Coemansia brasiliensis]
MCSYKAIEDEVLPYMNAAKQEKQRAQWSVDGDYLFVKILAEHAECSAKHGLKMNHCPIDSAIINEVASGLNNNIDVAKLAQELAAKYPNKKLEGRSVENINLLISLKQHMPEFTYRQLNSKHTNMCTRTIIPFHDIIDIGRPFKSKTIFDKDCKRFVKVIMEFYSYVIANSIHTVDLNLYARKSGKGSKLLEQWLTAMLNTHKQNMVNFLYACGIKLAKAYIKSKRAASRTFEEARFLESNSFPPKIVQMVLREYIDHIAKNEIDDAALGMPVTQGFMVRDPEQQQQQPLSDGPSNNTEERQRSPESQSQPSHTSPSADLQPHTQSMPPSAAAASAQSSTMPPYSYHTREESLRWQPYPYHRQAAYDGGNRRLGMGNEMQHAHWSPPPSSEIYSHMRFRPAMNSALPISSMHCPGYMDQRALPPLDSPAAYVPRQIPGRAFAGAGGPDIRQQRSGYYHHLPPQQHSPAMPMQRGSSEMYSRYRYPSASASRPPPPRPSFSSNRYHPYYPQQRMPHEFGYQSSSSSAAHRSPCCEPAEPKAEQQRAGTLSSTRQQQSVSLSPATVPMDVRSQPDIQADAADAKPVSVPASPASNQTPLSKHANENSSSRQSGASQDVQNELKTLQQLFGSGEQLSAKKCGLAKVTNSQAEGLQSKEPAASTPASASEDGNVESKSISISSLLS